MWPIVYELEDGGRLKVTDSELVPLGDVMAHRQITYTRAATHTEPSRRMVFEVRHGVPVCAELQLGGPGEPAVRIKDLTTLSLDRLRDDYFARIGVYRPNPDGEGYVHRRGGPELFRKDRKAVEAAKTRRKITPDFLQRVAEIYSAAPAGATVQTVRDAFGVSSDRQAVRYIVQAREMGFIK